MTKSNGVAENRRALEELTSAYQQVEAENRRLREALKQRTTPVTRTVRPEVVIEEPWKPAPGKFVDYIDKRGHDHLALVLDQRAGALRVKVFVRAVPNFVVEVPEQSDKRRVECWRRRA